MSIFVLLAPAFVKAKPPTHTSIPGILKSLQDEWDAVMLHRYGIIVRVCMHASVWTWLNHFFILLLY